MAEKGSFYKRVVAGVSTLAMLTNPAFAEKNKEVIDCRTGAYENTVTLEIRDGEREPISSQPDRLSLISRQRGGVLVEWRNLSYDAMTPIYVGSIKPRETDAVGIYVPGTAILKGFTKVHEITDQGRNANNTGNVVAVKGVCPQNAPKE